MMRATPSARGRCRGNPRLGTGATAFAVALALAGCSWTELTSDSKVDYRSQAGKTQPLEIPPDLTQLARDSRYQPQSGVVTASGMQRQAAAAGAPGATPTVAPSVSGDLRIERRGEQRWLVSPQSPEQLWPQLRSFWQKHGFQLAVDSAEIGVMETEWAENRARIPQDWLRQLIGKAMDMLYSSAERDRFRTRVERTGTGSEIFISHRGMIEVYTSQVWADSTRWQWRPSDPGLEAEFLGRLMVHLGAKEDVARASVARAPDQPARARVVASASSPATLEVDDGFDRAWRRVGLALDRRGFTVEDRDRSAGVYFVRYIDPKSIEQGEPGLLSKIFGGKDAPVAPQRLRVVVKAAGDKTMVSVLNSQGAPETGEAAKNIVAGLMDELR